MNDLDRKVAEARGYQVIDKLHCKDSSGEYVTDGTEYSPSTNIAQAMELLEELRAHGWVINIYNPVLNWRVCLMPTYASGSILRAEAEANNLSEAICLAYLKAKGKEAQDVHST